ncbi:MAG TPA: DUF1801 domain-containing protein [Nocardioidaceae bacterium]|nr:DUF1801 domain-containing protein [Nocardioidaceae bacterium]
MDAKVRAHLDAVPGAARRRDAETLVELMQRVTGEPPRLWGSIVGFGAHHYRYESGREGDTPAVGFAARKAASTIYLVDGVAHHADLLADLGPHTVGKGCLYVKDLALVDVEVLEAVVARSYASVTQAD